MTTKTRKLAKQAAGSVICDGQPLTVIDQAAITARRVEVSCHRCGKIREIDITPAVRMAIDEAAITARRVEVSCHRCGKVTAVDVTPAVKLAIEGAARGVLALPEGDYQVSLIVGYDGAVLSAQLVRG